MPSTERTSLLTSDTGSSTKLFASTRKEVDNAICWFELSRTNFAPEDAPMWKIGYKPEDLGVSDSLWEAFSSDLNQIYGRRIRFLVICYVLALLLSLPICGLVFAGFWWTAMLPAVLFGLLLRHELSFTGDCYIPLAIGIDDDLYFAPFQRICLKYEKEFASHGVKATVMADEEGNLPQRAYLLFLPAIESGSEGLYFV